MDAKHTTPKEHPARPQGTPPRISCIVPVYNAARFIGEAIASIRGQSHAVDEIIVVDDGSTDGLLDALRPHEGVIQLIRQENRGVASARNVGVAAARGELLTFLDADDLWLPEKTARQLQHFAEKPELELSLCFQQPFWVPEMQAEAERLRAQNHPFARVHEGHVFQAMMMSKATFQRVGPLNEALRVSEDSDWLERAKALGVVRETLDEVLFRRRMHQNNLSYQHYNNGAAARLDFVAEQLRRRRAQARKQSS